MHHASSAHTLKKQVNEPQIHLIKYIQLSKVFFFHVLFNVCFLLNVDKSHSFIPKLEMYLNVARVFAAFVGAPWIANPTLVSD